MKFKKICWQKQTLPNERSATPLGVKKPRKLTTNSDKGTLEAIGGNINKIGACKLHRKKSKLQKSDERWPRSGNNITKKWHRQNGTKNLFQKPFVPNHQQCPARDKVCNRCTKRGHFAKLCKSSEIYAIQEDQTHEQSF